MMLIQTNPDTKSVHRGNNVGIIGEGLTLNSHQPIIQKQCQDCEEELQMNISSPSSFQMQPLEKEEEMLQPKIRMQPIGGDEEEEVLQTKMSREKAVDGGILSHSLNQSKGKGTSIPDATNQFMSHALGNDFSNVKVHTGQEAIQMNRQLGARAFTFGNDVYFNNGEFNPGSAQGKHLLAHELTHVVQQTGPMIQKEKMPDPKNVTNLESYGAATRQNIKYDPGYKLQKGIKLFFQTGIVTTARKGFNVDYVVKGFPAGEAWVGSALKALALYTFNLEDGAKASATTNFTTVQHLDLSGRTNPSKKTEKGPNAYIRFTSTQFDSSGKGADKKKNVQLLIEKLSDYTAPASKEKADARRKRYENDYQIYNTAPTSNDPLDFSFKSMTDSEYDKVLEAMDHLPKSFLNSIKGIPIHKGTTDKGANGEVGEYINHYDTATKTWTRKIIVYKDYFKENLEQRKFTMVHELGHASDYRPNEVVGKKGGASGSASKEFRKAVKLDGGLKKGVSTYGATTKKHDEYYAEAFSMYQNYPDTLKAIRPNVYEYFKKKFP